MSKLWISLSGAWLFLLGVALSFDCVGSIAAHLHEQPNVPAAPVGTVAQDIDNLSGDWQRVGADLANAMAEVRHGQK